LPRNPFLVSYRVLAGAHLDLVKEHGASNLASRFDVSVFEYIPLC
jgi:hypothetical protein